MQTKEFFELWERRGYHVVPTQFYEPIPDTRSLSEELWATPSECVGIDLNEEGQRALLAEFAGRFREEYETFPSEPTGDSTEYFVRNGFFEVVESEVLYSMIRRFRPRRFYEAGSGFSTLLARRALLPAGTGRRTGWTSSCGSSTRTPRRSSTSTSGERCI